MVKLGSKVKDMLTGFTGTATGRTEWVFGCSRIFIEPNKLKDDGAPIEGQWFDEQRVEVVEEKEPVVSKDSSATTGGPQRDPMRKNIPSR